MSCPAKLRKPALAQFIALLTLLQTFHPLPVYSGCSSIGNHLFQRRLKDLPAADVSVQAPRFPFRLALGLPV